ncbi:hypothetical protein ACLD72_000820 [Paenibacillus sp. TH7-28]
MHIFAANFVLLNSIIACFFCLSTIFLPLLFALFCTDSATDDYIGLLHYSERIKYIPCTQKKHASPTKSACLRKKSDILNDLTAKSMMIPEDTREDTICLPASEEAKDCPEI